jgi:hypothetical protein
MTTSVTLATGQVLQPGCRFTARKRKRRFVRLTLRVCGNTRHGEPWLAGQDDSGRMHYVLGENVTRVEQTDG